MPLLVLFLVSLLSSPLHASYPGDWWKKVPRSQAKSWEILPQDAKPGQVVLSKRTELGIFSNFGETPFKLDSKKYASVEGLWQMMKYPDVGVKKDPRNQIAGWPYKRHQVAKLSGWEAKRAGDAAGKILKENKLGNMVSYHGQLFDYKDGEAGSLKHYEIIRRALEAKVMQNKKVRELLIKTKGLELIPDHNVKASKPPAYHYHKILMDIREKL